jgi:dihydrofolate reductase
MRNIDNCGESRRAKVQALCCGGSSTLYPQLLEANLIDRFLLLTCWIVLGKGKKLFGSTNMELVKYLRQASSLRPTSTKRNAQSGWLCCWLPRREEGRGEEQ